MAELITSPPLNTSQVINVLAPLTARSSAIKHSLGSRVGAVRKQSMAYSTSFVCGCTDCCKDMMGMVGRFAHQEKVSGPVIGRVFINVMHAFPALKGPAESLLHHITVLIDLLAIHVKSSVLHALYSSSYGRFTPYRKVV